MEKNKEKNEIKINLWTFYVLVASLVMLIAATVSGWLMVAKVNSEVDKKLQNNQTSVVSSLKQAN